MVHLVEGHADSRQGASIRRKTPGGHRVWPAAARWRVAHSTFSEWHSFI
jgi:hypothetical protein